MIATPIPSAAAAMSDEDPNRMLSSDELRCWFEGLGINAKAASAAAQRLPEKGFDTKGAYGWVSYEGLLGALANDHALAISRWCGRSL